MLAVIENQLEQPVGSATQIFIRCSRLAISVANALQIALRKRPALEPVDLVSGGGINPGSILRFIRIENGIAFIVVVF